MKFKRVLAMAVTAVMTCSLLAGCGGKTDAGTSATTAAGGGTETTAQGESKAEAAGEPVVINY